MVPVIKLTRIKNERSFADSFVHLMKALEGRPAYVDFDPTIRHITTAAEAAEERQRKNDRRRLLGEKLARARSQKELELDEQKREAKRAFNAAVQDLLIDGGVNLWTSMFKDRPSLIPVINFEHSRSLNSVLNTINADRFALRFSADNRQVPSLIRSCQGALSEFRGRVTLIIDAENIRGSVASYEAAVGEILQATRDIPTILIGNSFPRGSLRDHPRRLAIEERSLHAALSRRFPLSHGDMISIPRRSKNAGGNGWFPHVELVTPTDWHVELVERNSDISGYAEASNALTRKREWQSRIACWGTQIIEQVAGGDRIVDGRKFTTPAPWLAVRANQHLSAMALSI